MEETETEWVAAASEQGQTEVDVDQKSYLSGPCVMGSRRFADHILEHEEHCQEQEDSLPVSSTPKGRVVGELDCSPGGSETRSATWVGRVKRINS